MIGDYTYLWYDVRPHPNFGTVEVRVMDSQTRVEQTLALAALVQAMVKELVRALRRAGRSCRATRTRCSTRTSGWPPATGSTRSWWTCPKQERVPVPELTRRLMERLRPHAEELGSEADFDCLEDILDTRERGVAAAMVYEANHDLREVVREILDATVPEAAEATGE